MSVPVFPLYAFFRDSDLKIGLNILEKGMIFSWNLEDLLYWYKEGPKLAIFELSEDSNIVIDKFRNYTTDKLFVKNIYSTEEDLLEFFKKIENISPKSLKYAVDNSATNGHLEILKWGISKGSSYSKHTLEIAAYQRNYELLIWAHENGCPWNINLSCIFAMHGDWRMLNWAKMIERSKWDSFRKRFLESVSEC